MLHKFVQDFVPNITATASMLALLVVVDMLLLVQFGGIDGATLGASILKHWPAIGQPLDNHWPTIRQPLANHWPTNASFSLVGWISFCTWSHFALPFLYDKKLPDSGTCTMQLLSFLQGLQASMQQVRAHHRLSAVSFSRIASFGEVCKSLASMLLIKSAIDRFRSSFGLQRASSA